MPRTVAFLIFDGFQLLDAAGPLSAFEMPVRGLATAPYRLRVIAPQAGPVRSSSGAALTAEAMADLDGIDTLIVAGGEGTRDAAVTPELIAYVKRQSTRVRRLCSVCSGAYLLAAAGQLSGRRATTHWRRSAHFARTFPDVRLEPDRIFVRDGNIWTSGGVTAGIDLALALIGDDLGEDVAKRVARVLVVYHRRPGGQSQFSALAELDPGGGRFNALLAWARENVAEPLTVDVLAERCSMSARTFARQFRREVGVTPAKSIERLRLDVARALVEEGEAPIEAIADEAGFRDPERMRRAFIRAFGQPPQALRRAARASAD
ncbi:MAG: GlxA family transcriptional regulator [Hyphomicrobiaceae bacterium]|nr:GlxA family transcriptional regulator [Hyphomicrobiaceae bacterium]